MTWILLLGVARPGFAIDPNRTMSQYVAEHWGADSGFPSGPVYSISQTPDGYLWIGTERGLFRFDGRTFREMQSLDPELPSLRHVLNLIPDRDGSMWIRLLRPSLLRYKDGIFEEPLGKNGLPRSTVAAMTPTRTGGMLLWVLDGANRVVELRDRQYHPHAVSETMSESTVLTMAQTLKGDTWIGTRDAGLFRISGGEALSVKDGLPDPKVNALVPAGENGLWVGTDGGIAQWDGTRLITKRLPKPLDNIQALAMLVDRDSNLWVGTGSHGLLRVNAQGVASFEGVNRSNDAITALFEDREGNLWIGSARGLDRLRDSAFVTYSEPEGFPWDGSAPLFVDKDGRLWFSPVDSGLSWFKDGKRGRITVDGLDRDAAYSLAGKDGELWVGRKRGGLTRLKLDRGQIAATTYTTREGLAENSVYSLHLSDDGAVWAGSLSSGVTRLSAGRGKTYNKEDGLASNTVGSILEDSEGTVWFGTPEGLSAFSHGRWQNYGSEDGLPSNDVNCLLEESPGSLWVGTSSGLALRDGNGFRVPANVPPGLRQRILGIAADRFGSLWISTSNHVLRVNRDKLVKGALEAGDVREYGLADGLRGLEGVKRHRSVVTDSSGRIWISLNRGISVVDPARLKTNSALAIAHIQAILADGRQLMEQDDVHVPGGSQRITFGFTGLSLPIPDRVRFRYRLDGFDRSWSEPVSMREAVYTNLPPGSYRFRVVASNQDGVWNPTEATLEFDVDPLIWQTWWFRLGILFGCGLCGVILYRLRLHQVTRQLHVRFEERLAERTRIAQELHDTLLQGFLSASMQVHVASDRLPDDSPVKPRLTRAIELMKQVIDEGRNAVRGLRSSRSASLDLEHAFAMIRQELVDDEIGDAEFRVIVDGQRRPLHPLLRDEVYRIGREALVNAFRHARAKKIELELKYSPSRLHMLVRDDGRGIDPEVLDEGRDGHWGLSGMRERADRIGARFNVWSSTVAGTEIELSVPSQVAFQDHKSWKITRIAGYFQRNSHSKNGNHNQ